MFRILLLMPLFLTLIFGFPPSSLAKLESGMDASVVIGKPDFTTSGAGTTSQLMTLGFTLSLFSDGQKLIVADTSNNRILIWNSIPTANNVPADVVVGQPNFTSAVAGVTQQRLNSPFAVTSDGRRLFVADGNNHRVLIWNQIPTTNFAPADVVVGQSDFVSNGSGTTQRQLNFPVAVATDGKKLLVAEYTNLRVMIWNEIPTTHLAPADVVIGQPNFTTAATGLSSQHVDRPHDIHYDGRRLFIASPDDNRILIYNQLPTQNFAAADVVLGQPNFFSIDTGLSAKTFNFCTGVFSDGTRLYVVDEFNHRVVIWSKIPTENQTPADIVLGQSTLATASSIVSRSNLSFPRSVYSDGQRLFVTESGGNRILIYNLAEGSAIKLGPQFEQGKGVLGKVFWDGNRNGIQDKEEKGVDGVKVVSDTGIYAITDEDGKYHFPYLETGQRVLKMDADTLPEDAEVTTDNPYKVVVTEGILTKVSFGITHGAESSEKNLADETKEKEKKSSIMLKVSVAQESSQLKPRLGVSVETGKETQKGKLVFTIDCNYFLFIKRSELKIYDQDQKLVKTIELPQPVPLYYELPVEEITPLLREENQEYRFHYQVSVYDKNSAEDRTSIDVHRFTRYQVP